ncbi:DUF3017 domain-containing protein [Nocardioides sp. zg-DK7169]|uniref:DUF3017 domain-containing protein n=1 Tax=Nocardioides sp. zg-DK7169 TaxID=2736600 RepID=UPI001554425E|nr:DUF3017 domain-containing protein [Nocardioides sp. zg-DK7169]NPC99037.1 DUF3017 domain-containing protein [Nocardioides sp. zg-DK7169]
MTAQEAPEGGPDPVVPTEAEVVADLEAVDRPPAPPVRRYPSTIGGAFYIGIMLATAIGMTIVVLGSWRTGVRWIAGALVLAAFLRLVLPRKDAGMLAARHRFFDVLFLGSLGGLLLFLVQTIPDQPL